MTTRLTQFIGNTLGIVAAGTVAAMGFIYLVEHSLSRLM